MATRKRKTPSEKEGEADRGRLSLTSEEIEGVACGYWDVLERMIDATEDASPATPPPRKRR